MKRKILMTVLLMLFPAIVAAGIETGFSVAHYSLDMEMQAGTLAINPGNVTVDGVDYAMPAYSAPISGGKLWIDKDVNSGGLKWNLVVAGAEPNLTRINAQILGILVAFEGEEGVILNKTLNAYREK